MSARKTACLVTLWIVSTGGTSAIAGNLSYQFDFATSFGTTTFTYETTSLTAPGTDLTSIALPPFWFFPSSVSRDPLGNWMYFDWASPTAQTTFIAQAGLSFANVPGVYQAVPAILDTWTMFSHQTVSTTVDIRITDLPEPATLVLLLTGTSMLLARRIAGKRYRRR